MNKNKKNIWIGLALGMIFLVAIFFRFYHFPTNPPSLNWDEVGFGYNAYSILKTGKDEFGTRFPLYFRALDDYKLPVYAYLTVGSIAIFGYNDFAVRFSSAFLGTLTVLTLYFLVRGLLTEINSKEAQIRNLPISTSRELIPLFSSLFLAILPWHIQYSRMAAEANVGLFFSVLGVTLFLYGVRNKHILLWFSVIAFFLSIYSYVALHVFTPVLGLTLLILYRKEILKIPKKHLLGLCLMTAIFSSFFLYNLVNSKGHIRVKGTSVFGTQQAVDIFKHKEREMFYDATLKINLTRRLFHDNTLFTSADIILRGYLTHFSPTFLFFDYDEKQHQTPFVGLLYIWMLPLIPIGLYYLFRNFAKREAFFVLAWLLIAPIPASITWDIPQAMRVYGMVIPLVIVISLGVQQSLESIKRNAIARMLGIGLLCFFILLSMYYYFHQYMIHLPVERSQGWVYGRKEMTEYLEQNKSKYDRIVVSSRLEWPYIFMLYYSKYDPKKYLAQGGTVSGGWAEEGNKYDIYEFHKFSNEDLRSPRTLFVGKPEEFGVAPSHIIYFLDGTPAIYIGEGDIKTQ